MAERELAILLKARDLASGPIKRVKGNVDKLGGSLKRSRALSVGFGVGLEHAAEAGLRAFGGAIKSGIDSLVTLEAANATTIAIIKSTGGAAKVSATEVRTWAEEIEKATGAAVDDKAIQAAENVLLRSGAVTEANFKRVTTASVDLGAAMKKGPEAGAKALAKAMADPTKAAGALRKAVVFLTKADEAQIKTLVKHNKLAEAQALVLGKVEQATKGAAFASAGPLARSQHILADAWEDAKMALATGFLPLITKVATKLSTALADPKTMTDIKNLGQGLADGFEKVLDAGSKIPWGSIKDAMLAGKEFAGKAFDLFTGLPPWVQTAVITGWGLNKITGGALSSIVGTLAGGLIKGVLGMTAGIVNIKAGTVIGGGGVPGVPGGAGGVAGAGGGVLGAFGAFGLATIAAAAVAVIGAGVLIKGAEEGAKTHKEELARFIPHFGFDLSKKPGSVAPVTDPKNGALPAGWGKKFDDVTRVTSTGLGTVKDSVDRDRIANAQAAAAGARVVAGEVRAKELSVRIKANTNVSTYVSVREQGQAQVNFNVRTHTGSAELQALTG